MLSLRDPTQVLVPQRYSPLAPSSWSQADVCGILNVLQVRNSICQGPHPGEFYQPGKGKLPGSHSHCNPTAIADGKGLCWPCKTVCPGM